MILIVVVLVLAAVAGFVAQRRLLGTRTHDDPLAQAEGLPVSELVIPVRTLAALLLAFVLLSVYNSYEEASDQASTEAGAVLSIAQDAVVLQPVPRREVLGVLRCYAHAVAGPDWRSQAEEGRPRRSRTSRPTASRSPSRPWARTRARPS